MKYTPDNMMSDVIAGGVTTTYAYDADQWRVSKSSTSATTHFLRGTHGELLAEITDDHAGTLLTRDYVYAGSRLLASVESSVTGEFVV